MSDVSTRCSILSSFQATSLASMLSADRSFPKVSAISSDYGQVRQTLLDTENSFWKEHGDYLWVWIRAEDVLTSFQKVKNFEPQPEDALITEFDSILQSLQKYCSRFKAVFINTFSNPHYERGTGILDYKKNLGLNRALLKLNLSLSDFCSDHSNVFLLDTARWLSALGKTATSSKLWYLSKNPYSPELYTLAINELKSGIRASLGASKKLLILDLDDSLWGGIVGDSGWEKLNLGGHNFTGEAFADFQRYLKSLTNRGILLGIVSKNTEKVALEAIEKNPEMILKKSDFAGWKINWEDKAKNILELAQELNLGLQSVVFIDDNPIERARVREALAEVTVIEMPKDPCLYKETLSQLTLFDTAQYTKEDRERTKLYAERRTQEESKKSFSNLEDWLKTLEIKVHAEPLNEANLARTSQLLNKTNQMNLRTRRMSEDELKKWSAQENNALWTLRVSDKFSDSGLTGILSVTVSSQKIEIIDFILSCRVMGRKIEEMMLYIAAQYGIKNNCKQLDAPFIKTEKNEPCLNFFQNSKLVFDEKTKVFTNTKLDQIKKPSVVDLIF